MTRARAVFGLQALIAAVAAAVGVLALLGVLANVTLAGPSAGELARACAYFTLPDASLSSVVSLALGSIAVAVVLLGARSTVRQLRVSRRFLRRLGPIREIAGPGSPRVFEHPAPQAFCAGLLRPAVYISTAAVEQLGDEELAAVLAHEAHHARLRDPLRVMFARVLSDALFFLPGVRQLGARYGALAEVAADRAAVRAIGDRAPLAAALLTFESAGPAVVGIAPERVDNLLGDPPAWQLPTVLLSWTLVLLTVVGVVASRLDQAGTDSPLSLPLVAAQACMLLMAVVPLLFGAGAILAARRSLHARG